MAIFNACNLRNAFSDIPQWSSRLHGTRSGLKLWRWSLHRLMSTFELQEVVERRAQKAKELHGAVRLWFIYFFTWVDLWSHLIVVTAAWSSTAYILLPYLAIHFAMAASRSSLWEAMKAPLTWLAPEGGSTLHTSGCYAWVFYLVSYTLRIGCILAIGDPTPVWRFFNRGDESIACDGLPPWLRHPWWSSEATCPVNAKGYNECLESLPWWRAGLCNIMAARRRVSFLQKKDMGFVVCVGSGSGISPLLALGLAVVAWTLWAVFRCLVWCASLGLEENGQMVIVYHAQIKPKKPPSKWSQAKVANDVGFFCIDILSDLNGIGTFIWTGNFQFAGFSALVFALSFGQQLATGGFHTFCQEAANSLSEGCLTDELRRLTLTEKSVEAPLQLLIQFFSFLYVTFSDYAVLTFSVSMLVSLYSVVDAAYTLMELNLLRELSLQEVSTSYLSDSSDSFSN